MTPASHLSPAAFHLAQAHAVSVLDGSIEYVRIWLRAPHPDLGGRTPLSYLLAGKPEAVEALIAAAESGQPG